MITPCSCPYVGTVPKCVKKNLNVGPQHEESAHFFMMMKLPALHLGWLNHLFIGDTSRAVVYTYNYDDN